VFIPKEPEGITSACPCDYMCRQHVGSKHAEILAYLYLLHYIKIETGLSDFPQHLKASLRINSL